MSTSEQLTSVKFRLLQIATVADELYGTVQLLTGFGHEQARGGGSAYVFQHTTRMVLLPASD